MKSKSKPKKLPFTKNQLTKLLSESNIDPRDPMWSAIIEQNPSYFQTAALSNLHKINKLDQQDASVTMFEQMDALLVETITLLTLARIARGSYLVREQNDFVINIVNCNAQKGPSRAEFEKRIQGKTSIAVPEVTNGAENNR